MFSTDQMPKTELYPNFFQIFRPAIFDISSFGLKQTRFEPMFVVDI